MDIVLAPSPHFRSRMTIESAMYGVILALLPGIAVGIYYFGPNALRVLFLSVLGCLFFEGVALKMRGKDLSPLRDGSALLTGILLAMNVPAGLPSWMVLIGAAVAISLGKQVYGGLGYNPFNPALVARIFLLISYPVAMTSWPEPKPFSWYFDAVTKATPLGDMKTTVMMTGKLSDVDVGFVNPLLGNVGGSMGEISAIALLIGGIYMLARKIITWHIPVSFLGTVFVLTGIPWIINPGKYASPLFHIVAGGLMLGAWFMATDYVTSPVTGKGMIVFGIGCGLITVAIRLFGGYPEGVAFAILLMNGATPIIDRYTRPRVFGYPTRKGVKK
ncbi:MAG: RnfABCDGE type electron transport complex subunit D [Proteobacteria bacterium]|nr:RnfABCDGE type electron transport complex subunit D [Pseudomonadota bacterium]